MLDTKSKTMKHIGLKALIMFAALAFAGCYDRDIIDLKEFGYSLPNVDNLNHTEQGDTIRLTWAFPANIDPAFRRPLEVSIQKVENDIYRDIIIVGGEETSRDIAIVPDNK